MKEDYGGGEIVTVDDGSETGMTRPEQAEFELFLERKRKEVAGKLSGLHLPVPHPENVPANQNGMTGEAVQQATKQG